MDADLTALAAETGRAIVQAMVSDGWTAARTRLAALLGQGAGTTVAALDADRQALQAGRLRPDTATGRWEARMETLLERHPEQAAQLRALLAELRRHGAPSTVRQTMSGVGGIQAGGDVRDSGNTNTTHNSTTDNSRRNYGGIAVVVAVVAVLLIVGAGVVNNVILPAIEQGVGGSSITADTPCREYLQASHAEREQAVQRIAVEIEVSGAGSPFLILNVDDQCGNQLNTPVGKIIARQQY